MAPDPSKNGSAPNDNETNACEDSRSVIQSKGDNGKIVPSSADNSRCSEEQEPHDVQKQNPDANAKSITTIGDKCNEESTNDNNPSSELNSANDKCIKKVVSNDNECVKETVTDTNTVSIPSDYNKRAYENKGLQIDDEAPAVAGSPVAPTSASKGKDDGGRSKKSLLQEFYIDRNLVPIKLVAFCLHGGE